MVTPTHDGEILKVLHSARDMISDERHWTKGTSARNSFGRPVDWYDKDACQWCATAAIRRSSSRQHFPGDGRSVDSGIEKAFKVYCDAILVVQGTSRYTQLALHEFNDKRFITHKDVIGAFTRAIDKIERRMSNDP